MHINELLAYAVFYINNSAVDHIKTVISNFYSAEDITAAKKLLWEVAGDKLGPMTDRKSSARRSCSEVNIDDIFEGLCKLDASQSLPVFVAQNIDMIPSRQPEELNILSVLSRMSKIEQKYKESEDLLTTHAIEIDQLKNKLIDTNTSCRVTSHKNVNNNVNDTKPDDSVVGVPDISVNDNLLETFYNDNDVLTPKTPTELISSLFDTPKTKQDNREQQHGLSHGTNVKLQVQKLENMNKEHPSTVNQSFSDKNDQELVDDEGFQPMESRYARRRRYQAASLVGAPPPLRYVFVSRIQRGNVHSLFDFLKSKNINVQKVERTSHIEAKFKSFKVSLYKDEVDKIINSIIWPKGIIVRIWKSKSFDNDDRINKKSNNIDNSIYKKSFYGKNFNRSFNGNVDNDVFYNKSLR